MFDPWRILNAIRKLPIAPWLLFIYFLAVGTHGLEVEDVIYGAFTPDAILH